MPDEKLLSAYRILEVSPLPAGAICGLLLGDMGAEVIKLESPAGDPARHTGRYTIQGEAALFLSLNRNKRSLRLDLQKEKGRALFYRLLPTVDVLIEGLGPGEARQWQIDYDTCRKIRNDIIYLSLSGFGPTGPYAARPAHDPLIQAASGLMALTGEHGGPPLLAGNAAADFGGAAFSAFAVCAALFHRERSGEGQLIQHALLDAMLYSLLPREGEVLATGQELERYGTGHPSFVPYQAFATQDGRWLFLACFTPKFWSNLCRAIERPDLENDPRFATNPDRVKNRQELVPILEQIFRQKPLSVWLERLQQADIPCGPVNDLDMAMQDPQVVHNRMVVNIPHPRGGEFPSLAHPVHFSASSPSYQLPPPLPGQHSEEILQEIGLDAGTIQALKQEGII